LRKSDVEAVSDGTVVRVVGLEEERLTRGEDMEAPAATWPAEG
jgi:hypothetical protein